MSKKIQLSIAEPCHENWENMSPVDKGKFCGSCQKQVVDFSTMSDRQVAEFFKKPSTGSVCGRFMNDQLDREIEIPRRRVPWVKYFFQIALPAFLVSVKASAQTQKTGKSKQVITDTARKSINNEFRTLGMVATNICIKPIIEDTIIQSVKGEIAIKTIIKGKIIDESGQPVPFASIETGPGKGFMADSNGVFQFDENLLRKDKKIFVSSVGFESKEVVVAKEYEAGEEMYIHLTAKSMQPVAVNCYSGVRMGKVVMGGVSSIRSQEIKVVDVIKPIVTTTQNGLQVFPNPVSSGSSINVSIKKMEEGYYNFQLINLSGQIINQSNVWIDKEASVFNFNVPAVAAGNYFIALVNKKTGKKLTEKVIIQ
jgi:hypothetical protein